MNSGSIICNHHLHKFLRVGPDYAISPPHRYDEGFAISGLEKWKAGLNVFRVSML
jgi:hypothetical protein